MKNTDKLIPGKTYQVNEYGEMNCTSVTNESVILKGRKPSTSFTTIMTVRNSEIQQSGETRLSFKNWTEIQRYDKPMWQERRQI